MRFSTVLLALFLAPGISASDAWDEGPLQAVPLFVKPEVSTGHLLVMEEGLAVLRAQREPFAIVSAVGPTRTGKSSVLGRAFFRGENENLFKSGSGVTSFTSGAWITNRPVEVKNADGEIIRVLFIDTEGFSGVGGITSRTYEANLFGIIYLMSSAVIFNSMFPVDASTAANLNAHASYALQMAQALKDSKRAVLRRRPRLVWSVQGFNAYNLLNSGMEPEDLLSALRNSSRPAGNVHGSEVLGNAATSSSAWLVETLFEEQQLVPVRRPSNSDEVVANLGQYKSSMLSREYLDDVDHLREATIRGLQPVHRCEESTPTNGCTPRSWLGGDFVQALEGWLKDGFILDHSDLEEVAEDEAESLFKLGERNRAWLDGQCKALNEELRNKFYVYREETDEHEQQRSLVATEVEQMMKGFQSAALARMVESGVFWKHPGKGATLVETQTQQAVMRCTEELTNSRRHMEEWAHERETNILTQHELVRRIPRPEELTSSTPNEFVLLAKDSTCAGQTTMSRFAFGEHFATLLECAVAVSAECKCGRGFEYVEYGQDNGGFCGCGRAGTANTDCMEQGWQEDFSFGTNRYLMHNPACMDEPNAELNQGGDPARMVRQTPSYDPSDARTTSGARTNGPRTTSYRTPGQQDIGEDVAYDVAVGLNGAPANKPRRVCFDVYD